MSRLSTTLAAIAAVTSVISLWIVWDEADDPTMPQHELFSAIVRDNTQIVVAQRQLQHLGWRIGDTEPSLRESLTPHLIAAERTCGRLSSLAETYVDSLEAISQRSLSYAEEQEWQIRESLLSNEYSKCAKQVSDLEHRLSTGRSARMTDKRLAYN